jgi:hypothetical protein
MIEQLILPEYNHPKYKSDDYIISTSNSLAYNVVMDFPSGDNRILLINGPKHSGKSFLLNLWRFNRNAIVIDDISKIDLTNISAKLIAIDDIDKIKDEDSLFHLFNFCQQENIALLMTATDYHNFQLKDLSSRIKATKGACLTRPDDSMIQIFIAKHFSDIGLKVPNKILSFAASHLERDFMTIKHFIALINKQSLKFNKKISLDLVRRIIFSLQGEELS